MIVWRLSDALMAAGLVAVAAWETLVWPFSRPGFVGNVVVNAGVTVVLAGSVLVRRQAPLAYAAAVTVGTTILWWQCRGQGELPAVGYSSYLLAGYTLGAHLPRRSAVVAGVVTLAAWGVPDVIDARAGLPSCIRTWGSSSWRGSRSPRAWASAHSASSLSPCGERSTLSPPNARLSRRQ